jgi:hypothetical protein
VAGFVNEFRTARLQGGIGYVTLWAQPEGSDAQILAEWHRKWPEKR